MECAQRPGMLGCWDPIPKGSRGPIILKSGIRQQWAMPVRQCVGADGRWIPEARLVFVTTDRLSQDVFGGERPGSIAGLTPSWRSDGAIRASSNGGQATRASRCGDYDVGSTDDDCEHHAPGQIRGRRFDSGPRKPVFRSHSSATTARAVPDRGTRGPAGCGSVAARAVLADAALSSPPALVRQSKFSPMMACGVAWFDNALPQAIEK